MAAMSSARVFPSMNIARIVVVAAVPLFAAACSSSPDDGDTPAESTSEAATYVREIAPFGCHTEQKLREMASSYCAYDGFRHGVYNYTFVWTGCQMNYTPGPHAIKFNCA